MEGIETKGKGKRPYKKTRMNHILLLILYAIGVLACVCCLYSLDGKVSGGEKRRGEEAQ